MASELEATGDYRVLRKLRPRRVFNLPDGTPTRVAIMLDLETTGLDPMQNEVIELAMLAVSYSRDGRIFEILGSFSELQQPSSSIPDEITALTGISDEMVRGKRIDQTAIESFITGAAIILAHNASFDRPFAERLFAAFAQKPWGCSMSQVPWEREGFEGTKLKYLGINNGFFFDGHRALDDCYAAVEMLARPLPKSQVLALSKLLEEARRPTIRICAEGAPFEFKDILKARGYRWNDGIGGGPRAWWKEVVEEDVASELTFLKSEVFQRDVVIPTRRITAYERFSDRAVLSIDPEWTPR